MKKLIYLLVCISLHFFCGINLYGQCHDSDENGTFSQQPPFTSQSSIDSFPIKYPNCTEVNTLIIEGTEITSLKGLNQLTHCHSLEIRNTSLQNLCGLENLIEAYISDLQANGTYGSPGIYIIDNPNLESLNGIQNIVRTSELSVINNPLLKNLEGLNVINYDFYTSFHNLGVTIKIENNQTLENIDALRTLAHSGDIFIIDNPLLQNISGLENLNKVYVNSGLDDGNGRMVISNNPLLVDLSPIEGVSIEHDFTLDNCNAIQDLSSLNSLTARKFAVTNNENLKSFGNLELNLGMDIHAFNFHYTEGLTIENNPKLENISLQNYSFDFGYTQTEITISNNSALNICHENYVCNILSDTSLENSTLLINISNNAPSCSEKEIVKFYCSDNAVNGTVFYDEDCDQIRDSLEIGIPNVALVNNDDTNQYYGFCSTKGNYTFERPVDSDTSFSFLVEELIGFSILPDLYTSTGPSSDLDFAVCIDTQVSELRIDFTEITPPRPGFNNAYKLCVYNYGSAIEEGEISLDLINASDLESHLNYIDTDGAVISDLDLSWNFDSLGIFESQCYDIITQYDATTPLDTKINYQATIQSSINQPDIKEENNTSDLCQTVIGSFDPNDKTVTPNSIEYKDRLNANTFEYLIRFQNEGTAPAETVVVYDTLQSAMDMRSFKMISASHDYNIIFINENIIRWEFPDINLPAVSVDSTGSIGFIKFIITNIPDVEFTEPIRNRAGIYFDFNDPIITDYAIVDFIGAPIDLSIELQHSYLDCTQIQYDINVINKTVYHVNESQVQLSLDQSSNSETFTYFDLDGGTLSNDTITWNLPIIDHLDTLSFTIIIDVHHNFINEINTLNATTVIIKDDTDLDNNVSTINTGFINTDSIALNTQTAVNNHFCLREVGSLIIGNDDTSNDPILDLDSLNNLETAHDKLEIINCSSLSQILGFSNLANAGELSIVDNTNLLTIEGFNSLNEVGALIFDGNQIMTSLSGFSDLKTISSEFSLLSSNYNLVSIENFNPPVENFPNSFEIKWNYNLAICNSPFVCRALEEIEIQNIEIRANEDGCDNIDEINSSCNPAVSDLNITLNKRHLNCSTIQFDIDIINLGQLSNESKLKFHINESTSLETYEYSTTDGGYFSGDTLIWDIDELQPMNSKEFTILIDIENSFYFDAIDLIATAHIDDNQDGDVSNNTDDEILGSFQPTSLDIKSQTEMDNCYCLIEIPETLNIKDDTSVDPITNIDSLINLEKVETLDISYCPGLEELVGSSSITEIRRLNIYSNNSLQSISGFENLQFLESVSIAFNPVLNDIEDCIPALISYPSSLTLRNNDALSICNTPFICTILEDENIVHTILNNAEGCNTIEEIKDSCGISSVLENQFLSDLIIYPNPTRDKIFINYPSKQFTLTRVKLTSIDGTLVYTDSEIDHKNWSLDVSDIPNGIYFMTIQSEEGRVTKKLVIGK